MTDTTAEETSAPATLVMHGIYSRYGNVYMAFDANTLQVFGGTQTMTVTPDMDLTLLDEPGSDGWVDRMVRAHNSLARNLESTRGDLRARNEHIDALGEAIRAEAVERKWCEEYDEFAREWDLPPRTSEYEVTITVRVTAVDEAGAIDIVRDGVSLDSYTDEGVDSDPEYYVSER